MTEEKQEKEQKHYYYRTETSTALGKEIKKYLHDCYRAEKAADIWAKKAHAKNFYPSPTAFAGGVSCVSFEKGKEVNEKLWKPIPLDEDEEEEQEQKWVPNVEHRDGAIILPRKDFKPSDTDDKVFSRRPSTWAEVRHLYTRETWLKMIGMRSTGDKVEDAKKIEDRMMKELFCRYVQVYRTDAVITPDKRRRMPYVASAAIRMEVARLRLPVVSANRLFLMLKVNLLDGQTEDGKPKIFRPTTPAFFEWGGRYYIGCSYPCQREELEEITEGTFNMKRNALIQREEAIRRGLYDE